MDTLTPSISPAALLATLGRACAPLIIDVRRREARDASPRLIAGATWRNPFETGDWAKYLPRHRAVVAYCVHGHEISRNACAALREAGIQASYLAGGLEAWEAQGAPVVHARESPAIPSGPGKPSVWVTRERPKIDCIACPWLVRRFIDPLALFEFVPAAAVLEHGARSGAVPYDVPGAAFTHRGDRCTFDALVEDFGLRDAALDRLATIVRGADTDRPALAPECAGLLAISRGLGRVHADDFVLLEKGFEVYDALYAECRAEAEASAGGRR